MKKRINEKYSKYSNDLLFSLTNIFQAPKYKEIT